MTNLASPPSIEKTKFHSMIKGRNMAWSTQEHDLHHVPTPYGTTTAPPPTPSAQPDNNNNLLSTSEAGDSLSCLLHRIPPTLSLSFPGRRQSLPPTTVSPPLISLSDPSLQSNLLSAAKQHGFFQLTQHPISSHLAQSAESDSSSIFNLSRDEKQLRFPKNWPLGFDDDDDDHDGLCLDSTELGFASLTEFTCQMEKLGLEVIQRLASAVGFENPVGEDRTRFSSLMWISESDSAFPLYPFIVGLNYQMRCREYSMLADSGWVCVVPQVHSVMVTLGDIAQVWSNGKVKKVRGRPVPITSGDVEEINSSSTNSHCVSMTLLVTLAHENSVSPLPSIKSPTLGNKEDDGLGDNNSKSIDVEEESPMFNSFSFDDYAWRVYHERLLLKDPLLRYRV